MGVLRGSSPGRHRASAGSPRRCRKAGQPACPVSSPALSITLRRQPGNAADRAAEKRMARPRAVSRAAKARGRARASAAQRAASRRSRIRGRGRTGTCAPVPDHGATAGATRPGKGLCAPSRPSGTSARPCICKASSRAAAKPDRQITGSSAGVQAHPTGGHRIMQETMPQGWHGCAQKQDGKCRFLLPGTCGPRLTRLSARAYVWYCELLTQPAPPEHGCHWQLYFWTGNGGTPPSESWPLWTFVDPVSAPSARNAGLIWWSRRVLPPGPIRVLRVRLSP